jgi:hypothetical protein
MEQKRIKMWQLLDADDITDKDYSTFIKSYFNNDKGINSLHNLLITTTDPDGKYYYEDTLENFYVKYACDLSWAKKTTYCGGSGGGGNTTGLPDWAKCISNSLKVKRQNDNVVYGVDKAGNTLYFWKSGKFRYSYKSGTKEDGKWECNGASGYLIAMDLGDTFDGTKWIDKVDSTEEEKKKKNIAGLTKGWVKDPTGNTTWEYQVRDCKWIAKKRGIPTEYVLGDNPKYKRSVKRLNDDYPTLVANCKKDSKTDTKTDNKFKFDSGNFKPIEIPKVNYSAEMSKVAAADRNQEAEDPNTM